jgi:hypothetical protein
MVRKDLSTTTETILRGISTYDADVANASSAATGANFAEIVGMITPSVDGSVIARFAAETAVAAGITVKAGSYVVYYEVK